MFSVGFFLENRFEVRFSVDRFFSRNEVVWLMSYFWGIFFFFILFSVFFCIRLDILKLNLIDFKMFFIVGLYFCCFIFFCIVIVNEVGCWEGGCMVCCMVCCIVCCMVCCIGCLVSGCMVCGMGGWVGGWVRGIWLFFTIRGCGRFVKMLRRFEESYCFFGLLGGFFWM